ncbi:unnamed protein product [Rotaria sp. Silwood2]|nr:unnamed protein product [Rotaria sp. Silwood2]CAF4309284.1 unnamed protein product [Rotaria sp. Silwood2]
MRYYSYPRSVAVSDFNKDIWPDIAVANTEIDSVGVFLGDRYGAFTSQQVYLTGSGSHPYFIAVGDFNNDQHLDIAVANYDTNNVGILLGHDDRAFSNQIAFSIDPSHPISIAVGDFNNDTWLDIVVANYGTDNIGVLPGHGDESFENMTMYSTGDGSKPLSVAVDDVNNDMFLDIVVANFGTDIIDIFLGYGNGTFTVLMTYSTEIGSHPVSIAISDFNNDNWLDIPVANKGTNNVGVFLGYGNGTFTKQRTYSVGYGSDPNWIAVVNYATDIVLILLKICQC